LFQKTDKLNIDKVKESKFDLRFIPNGVYSITENEAIIYFVAQNDRWTTSLRVYENIDKALKNAQQYLSTKEMEQKYSEIKSSFEKGKPKEAEALAAALLLLT